MEIRERLAPTIEQMLREQLPNLFRLYLNPCVVQVCYCLERYIHAAWHHDVKDPEEYQSFLANSFDEALSGAIKLARYCASAAGRPTAGLVIDPANRLASFASSGPVVFLPGLSVIAKPSDLDTTTDESFGFVVIADGSNDLCKDRVQHLARRGALVITCVGRQSLTKLHETRELSAIVPDIVVFDESFVHHDVPFGAFAARKRLYDHWNRPGKTTFHSTTFQPNTISTLHFMRCLKRDDPAFFSKIAEELQRIDVDQDWRGKLFRRLYSPSLASAIAATGCDTPHVRAAGAFVHVNGRAILDGVSGVACSVRGHNPPTYCQEMDALADVDCEREAAIRLRTLTGLPCVLPAVSGAGAVENALKLALVAQFPRRHVLALKSGFGGKTLFALTGTWNATYKERIDPLYTDVLYVDPFAPDAIAQIDSALQAHPVAVAQMELIQGVGGVRRVPEHVVRHLDTARAKHGYLLLIDEIQTGMFRTGPFTLAHAMGLTPDLLVVGKAVSDMMFPFALTLYSEHVQQRLDLVGSSLTQEIRERYTYEFGYKTAVNVLRSAEKTRLAERVVESSALFSRLLSAELASCKAVHEVRVYGLLIGIELDAMRWPQRWFKKKLFWFYLASMLQHPDFPVLVGFCQYEPNVLKITPPLTIESADIQRMCASIGEVLRRPFYQLLTTAVGGMLKSLGLWRRTHEHVNQPPHELAAR